MNILDMFMQMYTLALAVYTGRKPTTNLKCPHLRNPQIDTSFAYQDQLTEDTKFLLIPINSHKPLFNGDIFNA